MATRDPKIPVTFILEDGDMVELVTWEGVLAKLTEALNPTISKLEALNEALEQIDLRLDHFIRDDEEPQEP